MPALPFFSLAGFRPHTTRGGGLRGFAPARRGPFVSAKGPKTIGARAWPPRGGACAPVPVTWAAELAALRQSSPPYGRDGTGAQPRPEAPGGVLVSSVMPGLIGHPGFGGSLFGKTRDDTEVVPYRLMVSVCRGGPGCPPFLSFLLWGFGPTRRGEGIAGFRPRTTRFFCFGKRTQNHWRPCVAPKRGACAPVPGVWAAELASLRQSSPPYGRDGTGAQPRPEAPGGARTTASSCHARLDRASRVVGVPSFVSLGRRHSCSGAGTCLMLAGGAADRAAIKKKSPSTILDHSRQIYLLTTELFACM